MLGRSYLFGHGEEVVEAVQSQLEVQDQQADVGQLLELLGLCDESVQETVLDGRHLLREQRGKMMLRHYGNAP